jgi:ribosomal protein L29
MTNQRDQLALRSRLEEVLGRENATTLFAMFAQRDDLATKGDLAAMRDDLKTEFREDLKTEIAALRNELKTEIAGLRSDLTSFRVEVEHRFATKDDLFAVVNNFNEAMRGYVRTFIVVQAATVVGMSTILFGLLRFT